MTFDLPPLRQRLEAENAALRARVAELEAELTRIHASRAWRIIAPLRRLRGMVPRRNPAAPRAPEMIFTALPASTGPRGFARQIIRHQPRPMLEDVTILTPTGDRLAAFARCLHLVESQSHRPREWLIVDDGDTALADVLPLPDWARVIRRARRADDPPHTLSANLAAALPELTTERVVIFEDDDWYAPDYLAFMAAALGGADLVGLNRIDYYHLRLPSWKCSQPLQHTALAETAFRRSTAGPALAALCADPPEEVRAQGVVDRHWWHAFSGTKRLIADHPQLHLGLKGGFGRAGLALGHDAGEPDYLPDPDGKILHSLIREDRAQLSRLGLPDGGPQSLVVYACHLPGAAPPAPPPPDLMGWLQPADLVLFSADPDLVAPGWTVLPYDEGFEDPARMAKKPKILPHLYFPDREFSLWLDTGTNLTDWPGGWLAPLMSDPRFNAAAEPRAILRRHNAPEGMRQGMHWWQGGDQPDLPRLDLTGAPLAYTP